MERFGGGWLTRNAADLAKVLIFVGGYCPKQLALRIAKLQGKRKGLANLATVCKAASILRGNI